MSSNCSKRDLRFSPMVKTLVLVFRLVTLCRLLCRYKRFRGTYCPLLQSGMLASTQKSSQPYSPEDQHLQSLVKLQGWSESHFSTEHWGGISSTLLFTYKSTWRHTPEDHNQHVQFTAVSSLQVKCRNLTVHTWHVAEALLHDRNGFHKTRDS
jgi:hypothetical protein